MSGLKFLEKNTSTSDLESSYRYVMFIIRKNKAYLTQSLVNKFSHVIEEVALAAGIEEHQLAYIDRFKADLQALYQSK
ncbi:MAG: hypothetical protein HC925_08470 [Coleofasciculaceae cyanobacterium SM2_3_26]|nr:hypothetical protein [Coleofasciculaceae cyanobacterium SM2_3_26]